MAGYDVYSNDDTRLTFNLDVAAAGFDDKDSWFGESESFLGDAHRPTGASSASNRACRWRLRSGAARSSAS